MISYVQEDTVILKKKKFFDLWICKHWINNW